MLSVPGAWVDSVGFAPEGVVVGLRHRSRRLRCPCGHTSAARYDGSRRRWRHLDLGACRLWLEADVRRVDCRRCGRVRTEEVPWARPGARHSRDFEDVVAWLAQRTDKTSVATLMRCSWAAVRAIIGRVVADHLDERRLEGLYHLGVDEISWRRGHHYLTIVANHDDGRVVWVTWGQRKFGLAAFYEALGPERRAQVRAVSMDLGTNYQQATREWVPHAAICLDPFHVIRMANKAMDHVHSASRHGADHTVTAREWRHTQLALRRGAERLSDADHERLKTLRRSRYAVWRAWELKERLRDLYHHVDPDQAADHLRRWINAAVRSRLRPFVNLGRQLRRHFDGIVAAVEWGLSNSRLEGINGKIRLINRRGYGHHSPQSLASMIYLCLGGITIQLPTERCGGEQTFDQADGFYEQPTNEGVLAKYRSNP